ncbi:DUF4129 domain-containing protein [Microbacterium aureliae]
MSALRVPGASGPPLVPDPDEARRWAEQELADPAYAAAEPTAWDRIARAVGDFFASLFSPEVPSGFEPAFALVAAIVVAGIIVAAFVVWGVPRAGHRARSQPALLFAEDDARTAAELRQDAAARAARGEWDAAVVLRFRALARSTVERGVVDTPPGTTVHGFARAAARAFPAQAAGLERAATAFDDVRYLRRPGTEALYRTVAEADDALAGARPVLTVPA